MGRLFGTDGVRGIANRDLTPELAYALGRAGALVLAGHNPAGRQILIGRDTRISGTMLEAALAAGICSVGFDAVLAGVVPTPAVAHLVSHDPAMAAGVVISASHNAMAYNGIKFFNEKGYKLPDSMEDEIEDLIVNSKELPRSEGEQVGVIIHQPESADVYMDYLAQRLGCDLSGLKLVVDCANGAASAIAPELFRRLGAEVVAMHCDPNGVNINYKCGSTHLASLQERVLEEKAAVGLAFDGDADRLLAVDEQGETMDGDQIIALCAKALKAKDALATDQIAITVMSNMGLKIAMEQAGIGVLETKVGDRYVLERMLECGAILGGEQSGHIIFADVNTTGDGTVTALHLLQLLKEAQKPLSQVAAEAMTRLPQVLENVTVTCKEWQDNDPVITAVRQAGEQLAGRGRVLVRPSGTEPLIRVMAEGPDMRELEALVDDIAQVIKEELAD